MINTILLSSLIVRALVVIIQGQQVKALVSNSNDNSNDKIQRGQAIIKEFIKGCVDAVKPNKITKSTQHQITNCSLIITGIEAGCFKNPNSPLYKGICTDPNLIKFDELKGQHPNP